MINEDRPCGNCGYPERAHVPGDDHVYDGVGGSLSAAPAYPQPSKWSPRRTLVVIVAGSLLGWLVIVHTAHLFIN